MAQEITLSMDGMLLNWLKEVGDAVSAGEVIAEFEADKATVEVEAESDGVLLEQRAEIGDELTEGSVIAIIGAAGEAAASSNGKAEKKKETEAAPAAVEEAPAQPTVSAPTNGAQAKAATTPDGRIKVSPLARRMAEEKGYDLSLIAGSGPGGRIIKADVENYQPSAAPAQPAAAPAAPAVAQATWGKLPTENVEIIDISRMRRAIADSTILSKQQVPHFYVTVEMNAENLLNLRKIINKSLEDDGIKISVNDMIVKATALALKQFPNLNSHYYGDKIVRHKRINIGIAVALPNNGLINVVSPDADRTSLSVMAVHHKEMFARARDGKIRPEDIRGATFTVSNLGIYDVEVFQAIISPPEAGILAIGAARKVPVVKEDGSLGVGTRMKVTISVDHRVSDGAEGAEYLMAFKDLIENPMRLLV